MKGCGSAGADDWLTVGVVLQLVSILQHHRLLHTAHCIHINTWWGGGGHYIICNTQRFRGSAVLFSAPVSGKLHCTL